MEHLRHFGLGRDPFVNDPLVAFYFASGEHANAERRLERAVTQGKGLCVVTGGPGTGKTMVVRHWLDSLEEEVYEACLLVPVVGVSDGAWVLTRFARQLGVEEPAEDRSELLGQIYEALAIVREDGRSTVLIIDEAQVLVDQGVLGELRGLLNLEYEDRRLLTLVLVGLPGLEHAIAEDPNLAHRVDVMCRIQSMGSDATAAYLAHRIRTVEGNPAVLESGAVAALCELGGGAPRRLNTLADNALFEAYLAGRSAATEEDVRRAASELELERAPEAPCEPRRVSSGPTLQISSKRKDEESRPIITPGGVNPHDSLAVALETFEAAPKQTAAPEPEMPAEAREEAPMPAAQAAPAAPAPAPAPAEAAAPQAAPEAAPAPAASASPPPPEIDITGTIEADPTAVLGPDAAPAPSRQQIAIRPARKPQAATAAPPPAAAAPAPSPGEGMVGLADFEDVTAKAAAPKPAAPPPAVSPPPNLDDAPVPRAGPQVRPAGPQVRPVGPQVRPAQRPRAEAATQIRGVPAEAVVRKAGAPQGADLPTEGPPKEENIDDLFVDLLDEV